MLYATLSEHGANSEEQAQRRERRGSVPLTDGTNEGEADLNEVEATRVARVDGTTAGARPCPELQL